MPFYNKNICNKRCRASIAGNELKLYVDIFFYPIISTSPDNKRYLSAIHTSLPFPVPISLCTSIIETTVFNLLQYCISFCISN